MRRAAGRVMVSVIALVLSSCSGSDSGGDSDESSASTPLDDQGGLIDPTFEIDPLTLELAAIREANDGYLPLQDALDLFASTFGEIPGGDATRFDVIPGSASLAYHALLLYWEELTAEQRAAAEASLQVEPLQSSFASAEATPPDPALQREIDGARAAIAARVGADVPFPIVGYMVPGLAVVRDGVLVRVGGIALAYRDGSAIGTGVPDQCLIKFALEDPLTAEDVAHEVFHCFQYFLAGTVDTFAHAQQWIIEASADWAASEVVGSGPNITSHYQAWVLSQHSLYSMAYEALGYYWVLDALGVSAFEVIDEMLAVGSGAAAVAASGIDPMLVLFRTTTAKSRARTIAGLPVSSKWDYSSPRVPPFGDYSEDTLSPTRGLREEFSRSAFATAPAALLHLEGGKVVQVALKGEVGTLEFFGKTPIDWNGSLVQEFCLEEAGCSCSSDGSEMEQGARDLILAGGQLSGGPISYDVRIPDVAFTDGHWQGTIVATELIVSGDAGTGFRPAAETPIEFTVASGAVTDGTYGFEFPAVFETPNGTAAGIVAVSGRVTGCGYSPILEPTSIFIDAVVQFTDGASGSITAVLDLAAGTMTVQQPVGPPATVAIEGGPFTPEGYTSWLIQPSSTPTHRVGDLDATAELAVMGAAGFAFSDTFFVFDLSRG